VDQSRRKIAVALHSLGDEIQPRRPSESSDDYEMRRKTREELIRRNRNELIRRAREQGVAVDLDELAKIGTENMEMAEKRSRGERQKSFDGMVGSDGRLRPETKATGNDASSSGLRQRGAAAGLAAGAASGIVLQQTTSDGTVLFDQDDDDEAPSPKPFTYVEPGTRESSATVEGDATIPPQITGNLIDLTSDSHTSDQHASNSETEQAAQSFYSFTSSASSAIPPSNPFADIDNEADFLSTGTLTPRSDRSLSTAASIVPSQADDIAVLSMQNDTDHDARSEVFSEGGFTDAGFSEAGFSELGRDGNGILTPSSWTDVGSDDEEWGGEPTGHVSQMHL
jgi:hypothetical protein